MDVKQAIIKLNAECDACQESSCGDFLKCSDCHKKVAKDALFKLVKLQPKIVEDEYGRVYFNCPTCNAPLTINKLADHCHKCGQALDTDIYWLIDYKESEYDPFSTGVGEYL